MIYLIAAGLRVGLLLANNKRKLSVHLPLTLVSEGAE